MFKPLISKVSILGSPNNVTHWIKFKIWSINVNSPRYVLFSRAGPGSCTVGTNKPRYCARQVPDWKLQLHFLLFESKDSMSRSSSSRIWWKAVMEVRCKMCIESLLFPDVTVLLHAVLSEERNNMFEWHSRRKNLATKWGLDVRKRCGAFVGMHFFHAAAAIGSVSL